MTPGREAIRQLVLDMTSPADVDGNVALGALRHLDRALDFVQIAADEYERDVAPWLVHVRDELERGYPDGPVSSENLARMEVGRVLATRLHLRIETFYVFAHVALDALVGLADVLRGTSAVTLGRHRSVASNLKRAAAAGELPEAPGDLRNLIKDVTARIKDYRDDYVAHVREPRQIKATAFRLRADDAYIQVGIVSPRDGEDLDKRSESPPELLALLDRYLAEWAAYLRAALTAE